MLGRKAKKKDDCHFCQGRRGGVPGNENIVYEMKVCDFCHADIIRVERCVRNYTLAAAAMIARTTVGGFSATIRTTDEVDTVPELMRDPDGPWVLNGEIAKRIESVQLIQDGRWQSTAAMKLWGQATDINGRILHEMYDGNGRRRA